MEQAGDCLLLAKSFTIKLMEFIMPGVELLSPALLRLALSRAVLLRPVVSHPVPLRLVLLRLVPLRLAFLRLVVSHPAAFSEYF